MKRFLILLGVVVVLAAAVVAIPARTFAMLLDGYDVHLLDARGTVWNGSAQLVVPGTNLGELRWAIVPQRLLRANLAYDISLDSPSLQVQGKLVRGWSKTSLVANAEVKSSIVNSILLHYEMKISGSIQIEGMDLRVNGRNEINSLAGTVRWDGGKSRYRTGDETKEIVLPPMVGEFSTTEGDVILTAVNSHNETELLNARLEAGSGWLHIGLTRQMFELVQMPWDSTGPAGAEVFKVSRQIFRRTAT